MKKITAFLISLAFISSVSFSDTVSSHAYEPAAVSVQMNYDESHSYSILDTIELGSDGQIPCYDCSSSMTSTKKLANYVLKDSDKKILQAFIDEHFTDDMTNTEKIQYTIDWLHNNIKYAITSTELKNITNKSLAECGFVLKSGQCLQYNGALAYMLEYMGYEANLIFLEDGSWRHYTCQIRVNGRAFRMEAGNTGLEDGSHYMPSYMLRLDTAVNTDENKIIGQCGDSAYFTFEKSTGKLTIDGIGDAAIYNSGGALEDYKEDIKSLVIEDGISYLYGSFFNECPNIEEISIPDSIISLSSDIFDNTAFIKNNKSDFIILGNILYKYSGDSAEVIIPDSVTVIGSSAFRNNASIEKVTVSKSVTDIREYAFAYCRNLTDVYIPDTVASIDATAFDGTPFIENQESDFVTAGNRLYRYKGNDSEVVIPENITTIGASAFANNKNITSVVFPPNLNVT